MNKDTYFIADTHIGFGSRRTVSQRGFKCDWERHEKEVVNGINRVIDSKKTLYILGDIGSSKDYQGLKSFLEQLNTKRIFLLLGNHDNEQFFYRLYKENVILGFDKMYSLKYNKVHFILCHYPLFEWEQFFNNSIHLYGHVHNNVTIGWRSLDVGIDNIGYTPISVTEVLERMNNISNVNAYKNKVFLGKKY